MYVFVVHHVHDLGDDEDAKLVGVYSSEPAAQAAIARLSRQPGFRDTPSGFHVDRYTVDEDQWTEGFVTVGADDDERSEP